MSDENDVTANKLAEENQVTKKEPQRVTTKNPKKVEVGKRLAESNHKKREAKKREEQAKLEKSGVKSIVNDLYQAAVISALAVGYSMLGKKILKMTPSSIQKFDLEDTGKLVAIIAPLEMTREYLIKQKILPDHINV